MGAVAKREDDGRDHIHNGRESVGVLKVMLMLGGHLVGDDGHGKGFEKEEDGFALQANRTLESVMEDGNQDEADPEDDKDDTQGRMVFADDTALQQDEDTSEYVGHLLEALAACAFHEGDSFYNGWRAVKGDQNSMSDWKVPGFKSMK
jgi:hypothetical protein